MKSLSHLIEIQGFPWKMKKKKKKRSEMCVWLVRFPVVSEKLPQILVFSKCVYDRVKIEKELEKSFKDDFDSQVVMSNF
jgi:hypothetical protein